MFQGNCIKLQRIEEGFVELCFDRNEDAINKFDERTLDELAQAVALIAADGTITGVLITSAKNVFVVGADINEFAAAFRLSEADLAARNLKLNRGFIGLEDLVVPSVAAINGIALGGGMELTLAAALRAISADALIGLPEVKLGLIPGLGGTLRTPRIAGADVALDLITGGKPLTAPAAQAAGLVDAVCAAPELRATALGLLRQARDGAIDWRQRQARKRLLPADEAARQQAALQSRRGDIAARSPKHQPAALVALDLMARAAAHPRDAALALEAESFAQVAKTQAADALIQTFHNEQALKKLFRQHGRDGRPVKQAAVLGAGIMGGGIAFTSALRGIPIRMKDLAPAQLDLGMAEVDRQLARQIKGARLDAARAKTVRDSLVPQLGDAGFDSVDIVIEAIVERLETKREVLAALEPRLRSNAIIASNTSSLLIDDIALALARPENLVGMHFFNPVPAMALVEIVQGSRTRAETVSTAVAYAVAMGKTPIVVKDCPGFLVNRILTPYVIAFLQLLAEGADFAQVDRVMEAFGWPMGPAYLQDVIGMDTGAHVWKVISAGYSQRMVLPEHDAVRLMVAHKRYGQKSGAGFYCYDADAAGKPRKSASDQAYALLATIQPTARRAFSDTEIVERLMLPIIVEAAHALADGVVASAAELDMALLLGLGFPAYLGGPLKYADWLGLDHVVRQCDHYATLGRHYESTGQMRALAASRQKFHPA